MAFTDVSTKGMNYVTLTELIGDFKVTMDGDDYAANASDSAIRNIALRGIRDFGFDVTSRVRSIKLSIESNDTVTLPDDYVDVIKVGIVDSDGILRPMAQNKNINYSQKYALNEAGDATTDSTTDSDGGPLDIPDNLILNRVDDKTATSGGSTPDSGDLDYYMFENYLYQGGIGRMYGVGGGMRVGDYRVNLDQNRLEIETNSGRSDVVLEYIADEARSTNPVIHVYAEEALRCYIYYKLCERKSNVPANEKGRARSEYYNERRKAKARLGNFTKDEALRVIRKNFKLAPKY
tara:strand:- start:10067 stop:10942 length:876 start_codon:yes stop_codon:yes gene_type:complete